LLSGCRSLWRAVCPGLGLLILLCTLSACASNTGIFGGGKWQTGALQSEQLQVLAVDPNHLQHLYAGDARDGVFVSLDTGQTWQGSSRGLPLPLAIKALAFDTQGERLFAATSHGLFVSADVAGHWNQVPALPAGAWTALTFDANAPHVVYAASAAQGIFKSSDLGGHWTPVGRGLPTGIVASLAYDPNLKQLWAAFAGALYRSDDGGASWHAMNNGLPTAANINVISQGIVTDVNRSLLFVGTDQGFFRSTDAGQHWRQSQFSLAHLHIRDVLADASQPGVVYVSTNIGVLRSNDNGQNWDQVASGLPTDRGFAALAQGGPGYTQLLVAARGIYLYPGSSAGTFNASRVVPALLILLFFLALYYFFSLRRRPRTRPLAPLDSHPLSDQQGQNGHRPASGQAPGAQTNERQEQ
jgi:ligand-binding sensor domain-containing protein